MNRSQTGDNLTFPAIHRYEIMTKMDHSIPNQTKLNIYLLLYGFYGNH